MENKEMITGFSQLANHIKAQLPLYDFISKDVDLERDGKYYKGKCPLIVDCGGPFKIVPDKNVYYCFGCHRCGDIISYTAGKLMESPLVAALFLADHVLKLDNVDKDLIMENVAQID